MAIGTEISSVNYEGNGTGPYPITFEYLEGSHVQATATDAAGAVHTLSPDGADFSVNTTTDTVTTTEAYDDTWTITLFREVPIVQETSYEHSGPFPAASHEAALDYGCMIDQQLSRELDLTLRFSNPGIVSDPLPPEPNTLIGLDAFNHLKLYDQDEIRELAQMAGGDSGSPTATFADAAARSAATPSFVGQLGIQRDTGSQWKSTAISAGAWDLISTAIICTTQPELTAALLLGGDIRVMGTLTTTLAFTLTKPGTRVIGMTDASGNPGKIQRTHSTGFSQVAFNIATTDWAIIGLKIDMGHPLTSDQAAQDIGISLSISNVTDISRGLIEGCEIYNTHTGIFRSQTFTAAPAQQITIRNNYIHSWCGGDARTAPISTHGGGIYLMSNCRQCTIANNRIIGQDPAFSNTHTVLGNCIWLGNYADRALIFGNELAYTGRHAIEYWNSQSAPANVDGNADGKICFNSIHHLLPYSDDGCFGITAFGTGGVHVIGNSVRIGAMMGIEVYNDPTNVGKNLIVGNVIELLTSGGYCMGISCDGVRNALIANNFIGLLTGGGPDLQWGINIQHSAENLIIRGNHFVDAGSVMIRLNAQSLTITGITKAAPNIAVVTVAEDLTPHFSNTVKPWYDTAKIVFNGVVGMTQINGLQGTMVDITGANTFTIDINTTAFSTYTSGGYVQEIYRRLEISDNTFHTTQIINGSTLNYAFYGYHFQNMVFRNNTSWVASTLGPNDGAMWAEHWGTVYVGHSAEAPAIAVPGTPAAFNGSNVTVEF